MIFNMGGGGVVPKYNKDAETITPGTSDIIIPAFTYLKGDLTIVGDGNLIPENIPSDVNIFGVQGTRPPNYGLNVWRKSIYVPEVTITNPSFKVRTTSNKNIVISNENFDLTKVTDYKSFFVNFKVSSINYFNTYNSSTGQLGWYFNGYNAPISSFDPVNKKLVLVNNASSPYSNFTGTFTFTGSKTFPSGAGDAVGFVVNDDSSAYPNGGLHTDGYYYELLGHIDSANVASLSNYAVSAVQADYRDTVVQEVES